MSVATRTLDKLLAGIADAPSSISVSDVALDSRSVRAGGLFLACRGRTTHGLAHLDAAVAAGVRAVLWEPADGARAPELPSDIYVASVPDLAARAGEIADRFFAEPSKQLHVSGITGTNGKTTCAWLLAQALQYCGRSAGYLGTLGVGMPPQLVPATHTTGDAVSVQRQLAALRDAGAQCVAMEVSSHALDQQRVNGVRFRSAAFTNLTRDHLDYHGTMQAYGAAKARLFDWPTLEARVINIDDPFGAALAAARGAHGRLLVTARSGSAAQLHDLAGRDGGFVRATQLALDRAGVSLHIESHCGDATLRAPLVGAFNADNLITVLGLLLSMQIPLAAACDALSQCRAPAGRMQTFGGDGRQPLVIVDYAHSPDSLGKALRASREHCAGQLTVVFGCGGDRDVGKRPLMGRIAAELADHVIITDDNPRTESPQRIVADILAGAAGIAGKQAARVVHSRAQAIREPIAAAAADDVVLVAGKGHEDYQLYGTERRAFSDQACVLQALGAPA